MRCLLDVGFREHRLYREVEITQASGAGNDINIKFDSRFASMVQWL